MHDPFWQGLWPAFERDEVRIRAFAHRRGQKSREWIARAGQDTGELETDALINSVFKRLLEKEVEWDSAKDTILSFFCKQIQNRVRLFERRAQISHLSIVNTAPQRDGEERRFAQFEVSADRLGPSLEESILRSMYDLDEADLLDHIARHRPELAALAELLFEGCKHGEQVRRLNRSDATIRRWRKQLAALIHQYRVGASTGPARPASRAGRTTDHS